MGWAGDAAHRDDSDRWQEDCGRTCGVGNPICFAIYGFLRIAGRTPIGITYESSPAARGHPLLSLPAAIVIALLAFRAALAVTFGAGQ